MKQSKEPGEMRAINIDSFLEAIEEARTPGPLMGISSPAAYDWGRIVAEGRAARSAADGGRWRIGHLAVLAERKYRSGALQRFAREIGESYSTVRRYRWVASRYDPAIRCRFPALSFCHFQAVASLPDRATWLDRAERDAWSVDRLVREVRSAQQAPAQAPLVRARPQIAGLVRALSDLESLDDITLASAGPEWLEGALGDLVARAQRLQERLARRRSAKRRAGRNSSAA